MNSDVNDTIDRVFDSLVKSRFIEMFGGCKETVPIGKVCSLHSRIGWQALTKAEHMASGEYMLITGTDFKDGAIDYTGCKYVSKDRYEMDPNIIIQNGDVLITKDGTIGKVAVVKDLPKPATLNAGVFVVRNTDNQFLTEFIQQCLLSPDFQRFIESVKRGATIVHLNQEKFLKYELPVADLDLQRKFVEFVQQVDKSKVICKQMVSRFDDLVKSRFIEIMSSSKIIFNGKLENAVKRVKVGFVGTCEKYYTDSSGVPMIRTGDINGDYIDNTNLKYVTRDFHEKNVKSQLHEGDLLIARHGSNGHACLYKGSEANCLNVVIIEPNFDIASSIFLREIINSSAVKRQINTKMVGSTQHVINTSAIAELNITLPEKSVQNEFEEFIR